MSRGIEGCLGGKAPQTICLQAYAAGRGRKSAKHPPVVSPDPILQCPWRSRSLRCILSYPAFRIQAPVSECAMLNRADAFTPKADCLPVALQTSGNHTYRSTPGRRRSDCSARGTRLQGPQSIWSTRNHLRSLHMSEIGAAVS